MYANTTVLTLIIVESNVKITGQFKVITTCLKQANRYKNILDIDLNLKLIFLSI